jgi:major membrane immunogen (membrane-anchored lipoprotein)
MKKVILISAVVLLAACGTSGFTPKEIKADSVKADSVHIDTLTIKK